MAIFPLFSPRAFGKDLSCRMGGRFGIDERIKSGLDPGGVPKSGAALSGPAGRCRCSMRII